MNVSDVKPVDPKTMLTAGYEPRLPTFEGTEIDRGQGKPKGPDGYHIITRCVQVWHVTERSRTLLPETSNGQFHSGRYYFFNLSPLTLSPLDGPYGPMTNIGKDDFSGG